MGNICRSPSAEGFFRRALERSTCRDLVSVDSAGTHSYHIGEGPDARAVETASRFGVEIGHLRARRVRPADFDEFDLVIAMDRGNLQALQTLRPANARAELKMMMDYHPDDSPADIPDPYYGGADDFIYMCRLLEAATAGLLREVERRLG